MKPKAIGYILLSYFQQNFISMLGMFVAIGYFLEAIKDILKGSDPFNLFLWALIIIVADGSAHLRRLTGSNAAALFPHYSSSQLMAFGMILVVFLVCPIILMGILGYPVISALAMLMFVTSILLWGIFRFGESLLILTLLFWSGKLVHEMLGFSSSSLNLFKSLNSLSLLGSKRLFPVLVIFFSVTSLVLFARYYLKISFIGSSIGKIDFRSPFAKDYDRTNLITNAIVKKRMDAILKNKSPQKKNRLYLARLAQVTLFSPGQVFISGSLVNLLVLILYMGTITAIFLKLYIDPQHIPFLLPFIYYTAASILTTDFLQHRHRLPALWMQLPANSRTAFAKITMLTYSMVVIKGYISISLGMLIIPLITTGFGYLRLLPVMGLGFILYILLFSLSLLWSDQIRSPEGKGWMLVNISMGFVVLGIGIVIFRLSLATTLITWLFFATMTLIIAFLLWRALKKWSDTEFNFVGPEI